jgi:hypothetical protein
MMQSNVRVAAAQTREKWSQESSEGDEGIAAKRAKQQVEPNHVRLDSSDCAQNMSRACRIVERPAPFHRITFKFGLDWGDGVGEDR